MSATDNIRTLTALRAALWGKTHYFDVDTMRFFASRVSKIRPMTNSKVLAIESVKCGFDDYRRERHVLVVNVETGTVERHDIAKLADVEAQLVAEWASE